MPITLNCPKCKKPFRVRDESVGLRVKCPNCQAILQVPASLSPASMEGSDVPPSNPGSPPTTQSTPKPLAMPVPPTPAPEPNRELSFLDELPPATTQSGPPSLPPHPVPRSGTKSKPAAIEPIEPMPRPSRAKTPEREPALEKPHHRGSLLSDEAAEDLPGWKRVRGGLRWVQIGLFFAMLPAIGYFVDRAYLWQPDQYESMHEAAGYLKIGKTMGQEFALLYTYGLPLLAYFFVLIGRLLCTGVPASAKTRGLASGTLLLTFLGFLGFVATAGYVLIPIFNGPSIPRFIAPIAWIVLVYIGLLAEGWFYAYLGQLGWPVGNTKIQREMAVSVLVLIFIIAGVQIAEIVLEHTGSDIRLLTWDDLPPLRTGSGMLDPEAQVKHYNRGLFVGGVYMLTGILFCFRGISVAGMARGSIRRWIKDHEAELSRRTD